MNYNPQYWQLRTRNGTADAHLPPGVQPERLRQRSAQRRPQRRQLHGPALPRPGVGRGARAARRSTRAATTRASTTSATPRRWSTSGSASARPWASARTTSTRWASSTAACVETMETDTARGGQSPRSRSAASPRDLRSQLSEKYLANFTDPAFARPRLDAADANDAPLRARALHRAGAPARRLRPVASAATPRAEEKARYRWRLVDGKICRFAPRDHAALTDMETSETYDSNDLEPENGGDPKAAPSWRIRDGTPDAGHAVTNGEGALRWRYRVAWDRGVGYPHIQLLRPGRGHLRGHPLDHPEVRPHVPGDVLPPRQPRVGLVERLRRRVARGCSAWCAATTGTSRATPPTTVAPSTTRASRVYARSDNALGPTLARADGDVRLLRPRDADARAGRLRRRRTSSPTADADRSTPELRAAGTTIFDATDGGDRAALQRRHRRRPLHRATTSTTARAARWITSRTPTARAPTWRRPSRRSCSRTRARRSRRITRNLYLDGREFQVNFATDIPQRARPPPRRHPLRGLGHRRDARPRAPRAGRTRSPRRCSRSTATPSPRAPAGSCAAVPEHRVPAAAPDGHLLDAVLLAQHRPHPHQQDEDLHRGRRRGGGHPRGRAHPLLQPRHRHHLRRRVATAPTRASPPSRVAARSTAASRRA